MTPYTHKSRKFQLSAAFTAVALTGLTGVASAASGDILDYVDTLAITNGFTVNEKLETPDGLLVGSTVSGGDNWGISITKSGILSGTHGYGLQINEGGVVNDGINVAGQITGALGGIHNLGTIHSKAGANGISLTAGSHVQSVNNEGTIDARKHGIKIQNVSSMGDLTNSGTIQGDVGGILMTNLSTASNIHNSGTISGGSLAISIWNAKLNEINNSGTITGLTGIAIQNGQAYVESINLTDGSLVEGTNGHGIRVYETDNTYGLGTLNVGVGATVNSTKYSGVMVGTHGGVKQINVAGTVSGVKAGIANYGTVGVTDPSSSRGIVISSGANVTASEGYAILNTGTIFGSVDVNYGTVSGAQGGIFNSGTIQSADLCNAISVAQGSSVNTIVNEGSLKAAKHGINLQNASHVESIVNNGAIEANKIGINVQLASNVGSIENGENGVITALGTNGINLVDSSKVQSVINKGTIEATSIGINVSNSSVDTVANSGKITGRTGINVQSRGVRVEKLDVLDGSDITATYGNGIRIGNTINPYNTFTVGELNVQKGAKLTSLSHSGILIRAKNGVEKLNFDGTIDAVGSGILNAGTIGQTGTVGNFVLGDNATIYSTTGYAIENRGVINGSVQLNGDLMGVKGTIHNSGTITGGVILSMDESAVLSNEGTIEGDISVEGKGKLFIKEWVVGDVTKSVHIAADSADKVSIEKVTYNDAAAMANAANSRSLFSAAMFSVNGEEAVAQEASLSADLQKMGFSATSQKDGLAVTLAGEDTAGGLLAQNVATQAMRRDFFVDTMVEDASQSAQFHAANGKAGSVFVKPYGSRDNYDFGQSELSGNTYGLLVGSNFMGNDLGLTAFMGYESSNLDSGLYGLDTNTFYVGATGFNNFAKVGNSDVFVKAGVKAAFARNELSRSLTDSTSSTKTNSTDWSAKVQLGMNWKAANNTVITPTVGLGYSRADVNDFALANTTGADRYAMDAVSMPYAEVGMNWQQSWTDAIRTNIGGGVRVLFDKEQSMQAQFTNASAKAGVTTTTYNLSTSYEYVTANLTWALDKANEISVGYTGVFEGNGQSHNMTAKYEYLF